MFARLCENMQKDHVTLLLHTDARWLSRGKVFKRVFELRQELLLFFKENNKASFCEGLESTNWQMKRAYLADIYQHLSNLNTSMQGVKENILTYTDKLLAFKNKLAVWKKKTPFKKKRRNISTPTSNSDWIWKCNSINYKSFRIIVRINLLSTSPPCHQILMTGWETPSLSSHQVQKTYLVCKKRNYWVNYSAIEPWKWNLLKYHLTSFGFQQCKSTLSFQ